MKLSYEYYKRNKLTRTKENVLYLIKQFPGISFTELSCIISGSTNLSSTLRDIKSELIVIHDKTPMHISRKNPIVIRSLYFHKDMLCKIEGLIHD